MRSGVKKPLKILYAVQGTGNGHVARARDIIPVLQKYGEVDVVLSGDQSQVKLPVNPAYRCKGLTFIYNKRGGVSYGRTLVKNKMWSIGKEVYRSPVRKYDLVINDFECITAWACKVRGIKSYGLGHQASFISDKTPRPAKKDKIGEFILKHYAPSSEAVGFHFDHFDHFIQKPVIRKDIRNAKITNKGHYTVYLPAYSDEALSGFLGTMPATSWEVFSKRTEVPYEVGNISFKPISNKHFVKSFISCAGIFTSAGFETPAEALFMGKKLMVLPIKGQYEQYCNAAALEKMGIPVIYDLAKASQHEVFQWVREEQDLIVDYPDATEEIIYKNILERHLKQSSKRYAGHN